MQIYQFVPLLIAFFFIIIFLIAKLIASETENKRILHENSLLFYWKGRLTSTLKPFKNTIKGEDKEIDWYLENN